MTISTDAKTIPETFDVNIEIPEQEILKEYEELSTAAAKKMMTVYLSQLALNSAIGTVLQTANKAIPGGAEFDQQAQDAVNKLLDTTGHMIVMEFALKSMGYSETEARVFSQAYALKARDIESQTVITPPPAQKRLPNEVQEVLDKISAIATQSPRTMPEVPQRPRKQDKK